MSEHERFREMLARRAELAPAEETELRSHLAGCPDCRETAQAYSRQSALLRSLPVVDAPPALRAGVLAGIREAPPVPFWRRRPALALVPLAAALLIVVSGVAFLTRPHGQSSQSVEGIPPAATPTAIVPGSDLSVQRTASPTARPATRHRAARPGAPPTSTPVVSSGNQSGEVALGAPPPSGAQLSQAPAVANPTAPSFGPIHTSTARRNQAARAAAQQGSGPAAPTTGSAAAPAPTSPPTAAAGPTAASAPRPPSPAPTAANSSPPSPTGEPAAPTVPSVPTPGQAAGVSVDASKATPVPTPPAAAGPVTVAAPIATPVPPPAPVKP